VFGAGLLPLVSPILSLGPRDADTGRPDSDPHAYAQIARCQRELYWTSPARPLFEAAYAHTQLGVGLVRGAGESNRVEYATSLAETALLAARLAFFDLGQAAVANRCYDMALAATREAGDHGLAAAVLAHMALVPGFGHQPERARTLIAAALQHTWHGVSPVVRSWLHCVASEVEGRAGAGAAGRHHIDLAETALDTAEPQPEWMDFYDLSRLHSYAGYAALVAGDRSEAADRLERSLAGLGPRGTKQRTVVLADLATAHGADGDRAADYLDRALDTLQDDWYGTGLDRIREVRPILGDSGHGRRIDERIAALTTLAHALPSG
jgi:tetratricopeptide (TPR) repeat protein